jgi:sterol desaturase/sphingolipid hydroxylase (fatty acid hydroxylase superfamily)
LNDFVVYAWSVVVYPLDPNHRIYVLYLVAAVVAAFFVYEADRNRPDREISFLRFLFPKRVWQHPSAWLDLRYFYFHMLIGHFLLLGLGAWAAVSTYGIVTGDQAAPDIARHNAAFSWADLGVSTLYMFASLALVDFLSFYTHYLQHKLPILWQFHKVHHSAEVMHPVSNFREHPVDNLVYVLVQGLSYGVVSGIAVRMFGYVPSEPALLGVPLLIFAFNLLAYNLRHSHIWLRWPGRWAMVFASPAHHHVHHSCHPDHLDKNFAFIFPVWDVIFRTYVLPMDNRDVKFGLAGENAGELTTCARLYFVPVRDAYRLVMGRARKGQSFEFFRADDGSKSQAKRSQA